MTTLAKATRTAPIAADWHVADLATPVLVTGPARWDEAARATLVPVRHDASRDDEGATELWSAVGFPTWVLASEIRNPA